MSVGKYSFINAKIRALKADILSLDQWDALIGARDMQAALRILDTTRYANLMKDFDATTSPLKVEQALRKDFTRVLVELFDDAPTSTHNMMVWISRKFLK